jgi:uncharacterized protein (TIGR02594 family)
MRTARTFIGLREVPGPKSNPRIVDMLVKLKAWWKDDATPWCGVFVAYVMQDIGQPIPKDWMRAKAWADWGSRLLPDRLSKGAVLVFGREGGGHVGFYEGEDATHYHVLGGNQSDAVNVSRIAKTRLLASRWPKGEPVIGGPVRLKANGAPVSGGEA